MTGVRLPVSLRARPHRRRVRRALPGKAGQAPPSEARTSRRGPDSPGGPHPRPARFHDGGGNGLRDTAVDPGTCLRGDVPHLDADSRMILEALGSGLTDASAAERLGVSLRTYRRHVAELEADSRFQAGLRAGEPALSR